MKVQGRERESQEHIQQVTKRRTAHEKEFICICIVVATKITKNTEVEEKKIATPRKKNAMFVWVHIKREQSMECSHIVSIDRITYLHFFSWILKLYEKRKCQQRNQQKIQRESETVKKHSFWVCKMMIKLKF